MTMFRCSLCVLALSLFTGLTPRVYADDVSALIEVNGSLFVLAGVDIAGVENFTYTDLATNVLDTRSTTFTATYTDDLGIGLLNVTDVCAQVTVAFSNPVPCESILFSFTDVSLLDASVVAAIGTEIDINTNTAQFAFLGADVAGGSGSVQFTNPPPPPPSATPEPESLAFLATGIFGVAGVARRKRKI